MGRTMRERFDSEAFEKKYHCDAPLGAIWSEVGTRFALWAPTASRVTLSLYRDGSEGEAIESLPMLRGERGLWLHEAQGNLAGVYYDYDVTVRGVTRRTPDPYAKACGINGRRSMVVDLQSTNPAGWALDCAPQPIPQEIVSEIHVKDFSWDEVSGVPEAYRGKYKALTLLHTTLRGEGEHPTCMAHLKRLGVTHVQLMPVYDFGSVDEAGAPDAFNWGYDPVNMNVPEGSYATDASQGGVRIRELKEAIMALHQNGFRVIMDVVYNHTYRMDSPLFCTVPWYFYRQQPNGKPSNGSGCGNEIATERSMAARYIVDSVLYWAEEYHIDGFRFDLMGAMDASLMKAIRAALDARFGEGEKRVYGEPWAGGVCHPRAGATLCDKGALKALEGIGAFCDDTRDAIKGSVMDAKGRGFVNGGALDADRLARCVCGWSGEGGVFASPAQTISYLSCHDDWTLWDKLVCTLDDQLDFCGRSERVLRANRLAAAMLFGCMGTLFMLSGEEFGRTKRGIKNSYCSPLAVNALDWRHAKENEALVDYYRGLIALRKRLPALCDRSKEAEKRLLWKSQPYRETAIVCLDQPDGELDSLLLCFNCGERSRSIELPEGRWACLADGADSFLWEKGLELAGEAEIKPTSALIFGRIREDGKAA